MIVKSKEKDEDLEEMIEAQLNWLHENGNLFCDLDVEGPEESYVDVTIEDFDISDTED
jgi:hypothetical protein